MVGKKTFCDALNLKLEFLECISQAIFSIWELH